MLEEDEPDHLPLLDGGDPTTSDVSQSSDSSVLMLVRLANAMVFVI